MAGHDRLDMDVSVIFDLDGFLVNRCRQPFVLEQVLQISAAIIPGVETLDVEVLIVGRGVGDGPGHVGVVAEVRKARHAGE